MDNKLIPGTNGFLASITGVIYDKHGNERNLYTNGDGYLTASVSLLSGKWQTFGVHRLVALAHIPFSGNLAELTVNHRDGDIRNNYVRNLEWVSVANNNIHAALLRGSKDRPTIIALRPDGVHEFISNIQTAAKRFGCDIDLIWDVIRDNLDFNGWHLMHYGAKSTMPVELRKNIMASLFVNGKIPQRAVEILNIHTQEIEHFSSLLAAGLKHGVTATHIFNCVSTSAKKRLFKKHFLIVDANQPFPILSQEEYENLLLPTGKEVLAFNESIRKKVIYPSASSFIKENGLSKKAVTVDLKKNRLRKQRDWWYTYFTPENEKRFKAIIGCPGL